MNINNIYYLVQVKTNEATGITNVSATLIDHLFTNKSQNVKSYGLIHNGMSDHSIMLFTFGLANVSSHPRLNNFRSCNKLNEFRKMFYATRNGSI